MRQYYRLSQGMYNPFIHFPEKNGVKIGWVTYETLHHNARFFWQLTQSGSEIRAKNIPRWLNKNTSYKNSLYKNSRKYDVVTFVKVMDEPARTLLAKLKKEGVVTVFDANVNFYEIWGKYTVPENKATQKQVEEAFWMTKNADCVIADSTHIKKIINRFRNNNVVWIPDNVNTDFYKGKVLHKKKLKYRLIWSGVSSKSLHLLLIKDVLHKLSRVFAFDMVLVSEKHPDAFDTFREFMDVKYVKFSHSSYRRELMKSDVIISPKYLTNGYDLGHSEFKITLGMAMGLPAVASPQKSYIDAINYKSGGLIAKDSTEWTKALTSLFSDVSLRKKMGNNAYVTVREKYSTDTIAKKYMNLFKELLYE